MNTIIYIGIFIAILVFAVLLYRYVTCPRDYWFEELTDDLLDFLDMFD